MHPRRAPVPLIITIGGTALAQCHAALPQWESEMWRARDVKAMEVVCLTAGNGSSHAIVIKSHGCGRRLEDMASGRIVPSRLTSVATFILTILWILHMMVVQSIDDGGWYLLAIGVSAWRRMSSRRERVESQRRSAFL